VHDLQTPNRDSPGWPQHVLLSGLSTALARSGTTRTGPLRAAAARASGLAAIRYSAAPAAGSASSGRALGERPVGQRRVAGRLPPLRASPPCRCADGDERFSPEEQEERDAHREASGSCRSRGRPHVGGAYALKTHTGSGRTKDLDLFLRKDKGRRAAGPWLERVPHGADRSPLVGEGVFRSLFIDLIFSSGNGHRPWRSTAAAPPPRQGARPRRTDRSCRRDDLAEGVIRSARRLDGADITHLLRQGRQLDWDHLLWRFGERHWRCCWCT